MTLRQLRSTTTQCISDSEDHWLNAKSKFFDLESSWGCQIFDIYWTHCKVVTSYASRVWNQKCFCPDCLFLCHGRLSSVRFSDLNEGFVSLLSRRLDSVHTIRSERLTKIDSKSYFIVYAKEIISENPWSSPSRTVPGSHLLFRLL